MSKRSKNNESNKSKFLIIVAMFCVFGLGFAIAQTPGLFGVTDLEPHEIGDEIFEEFREEMEENEERMNSTLEDFNKTIEEINEKYQRKMEENEERMNSTLEDFNKTIEENLEDTKSDLEGNIEDLEGNIENLEQEMEELSVGNVFVLEGENPVCPGDSVFERLGGPSYRGDNMIMRYFEGKYCGERWNGCATGEKWSISVPSCLYGGDNQNTCTADSWTKVLCKSDDN